MGVECEPLKKPTNFTPLCKLLEELGIFRPATPRPVRPKTTAPGALTAAHKDQVESFSISSENHCCINIHVIPY